MARTKLATKYPAKMLDIVRLFDKRYKNQLFEECDGKLVFEGGIPIKDARRFAAQFNAFLKAVIYTGKLQDLDACIRDDYTMLTSTAYSLQVKTFISSTKKGEDFGTIEIIDNRLEFGEELFAGFDKVLHTAEAKLEEAYVEQMRNDADNPIHDSIAQVRSEEAEDGQADDELDKLPSYMQDILRK